MEKMHFEQTINAPAEKVYDTMLGTKNINTYEQWTAEFNPTSTYEGEWQKGERMLFVGTTDDGKKEGMVSEIVENTPFRFVSIRHIGMLKGGQEITEGPEVEKWAGSLENYSFEENSGITTVSIEIDVVPEYKDYFSETWPRALNKLKALAEG
ncbi:MAG: SRPBCC domain-containing protein [Flavobacteriales bacterium]|nr:SRPBCC domain-containing protein [Flavobacteriales bacterium]